MTRLRARIHRVDVRLTETRIEKHTRRIIHEVERIRTELVRRVRGFERSIRLVHEYTITFTRQQLRRTLEAVIREAPILRTAVTAPEHIVQLQSEAEYAWKYLNYDLAPPSITLCTHEYCCSSRIFIKHTPNKVGVSLYFAYTIWNIPERVLVPFSTGAYNFASLTMSNVFVRKWYGDVWTSVIVLTYNYSDPEQLVSVLRDDAQRDVIVVPAYWAMYFPHRILSLRYEVLGVSERIDVMRHCSTYYMPHIRAYRRKSDYYDIEVCLGRFCYERWRYKTLRARRW